MEEKFPAQKAQTAANYAQGMAQPFVSKRVAGWVAVLAAAVGAAGGLLHIAGPHRNNFEKTLSIPSVSQSSTTNSRSILSIFATSAFDWTSSTTPAPLSAAAVLVKAILADIDVLPPGLESAVLLDDAGDRVNDVHVGPVRDVISARVLREVQQLCSSSSDRDGRHCDPNEVDPEFGTTPLHLAEFWGSSELVEYLTKIGADPTKFDTVGRQPRNMTFKSFSTNSKKAAEARLPAGARPEDRCEIPEVTLPVYPRYDAMDDTTGAPPTPDKLIILEQRWRYEADAGLREVRRLVSEGEPVMVRNMIPWLLQQQEKGSPSELSARGEPLSSPSTLRYPDAAAFAEAWGHRPVDVGGVPYAKYFDLLHKRTTLRDYVAAATSAASAAAESGQAAFPNYVFQVDTEACAEGSNLLSRVVDAALPSSGDKPIVCPPPSGLRGLESVHYYLGGRGTGAPFHIHSDAINLAISGKKRWWMVTPRDAVWSRRHIREYTEELKGGPRVEVQGGSEGRPMECVQRGGDLVYVPGEWGHAASNLEDDTFGYTLELVNRRDTLASVLGAGCEL